MTSMTMGMDEAQITRAVQRYSRFLAIKRILGGLLTAAMLIVAYAVLVTHGILWALLVFFVGTPVLGGVLGVVIALPLGYLLCGRDAMRLARALTN